MVEGIQAGINLFAFMPHRIWSIMNNTILISVPMFVLMGIILQKSRLAERLLEAMGFLFGEVRGGLAISTVLVGALSCVYRCSWCQCYCDGSYLITGYVEVPLF